MDDDVVVLRLVGGRLPAESWVYAVVTGSGTVLHVGSTSLPPAVRTWLHLESEDPAVGRLRSVDPALLADAVVVAVPAPPGVDRQVVRDLARRWLGSDVAGADAGGADAGGADAGKAGGGGTDAGGPGAGSVAAEQVCRRLVLAVASV